MQTFGNLFTHYNYSTVDITQKSEGNTKTISSTEPQLLVTYQEKTDGEDVDLPEGSPFATWHEARKFAGPLPNTFTYNAAKREVLIIEGVRENWRPAPVRVLEQHVGLLDELGLGEARLANAFAVRDIPYRWEKGRIEKWEMPS
jgi:hypothetical protein